MQRRLRFALAIIISQILLIALAISWLVHMSIIAMSGSVCFVENDPVILWIEIALTVLITTFGIYILVVQIKKLGERRSGEVTGDRSKDRIETARKSSVAENTGSHQLPE
jgi:protein-S-isoprenylcysteine O-methyltransferase Ste14